MFLSGRERSLVLSRSIDSFSPLYDRTKEGMEFVRRGEFNRMNIVDGLFVPLGSSCSLTANIKAHHTNSPMCVVNK